MIALAEAPPELAARIRTGFADPDATLSRMARERLIFFAERMQGASYQPARHHWLIANHLEAVARGDIDRLVITMPPRHGKSELASVHFPAWFLGNFPNERIIACSYSASLSYRFSRRARNLLYDSKWPFANVKPSDDNAAVQSWDLAGYKGGYLSAGVGGSITGFGANCLLIDDPVKSREEADSERMRELTWEWFVGTAITRLERNGRVVLIGTRWHEDDLLGRALNMNAVTWNHLSLQAVSDSADDALGRAPGEPLWPAFFDAEWMARQQRVLSSREWEAQYQQRPAPQEGAIFQRSWWRRYSLPPVITRAILTLDSAFKDGVQNDYSVIQFWGTDGEGSYYLLDSWRGRVEFPELIRACHDMHAKCRHAFPALAVPLLIEDAASGQSALQVLSRPYVIPGGATLPALPVIPYKVGDSKIARAEAISPLVEAGRVHLPADAHWVGDMIEEAASFPAGKHDDQVDAMSMGLSRLSRPKANATWSF